MRYRPVIAAVVLLAAACGTSPAASEPTTLRVVMADDWASAPIVGEVIDAFEREHTDVRVQVQGSPFSQIPEVVRSAIELGQPHDLAHWHAFAAAADGLAEPIDDLWDAAGLTDGEFLPGAMEDVVWAGRRYGVPLDTNALVLMVNDQRFRAAGLDADDVVTLDGFDLAAATLVDGGHSRYAITVSASSWAAYGWIVAHGGSLVDEGPDGSLRFHFDHPATVAAIERLAALVLADRAPTPFSVDLALEAIESFADGTTAMHTSGSWDLPVTRRAVRPDLDIGDVRILPLPQADPGNPRTVLGGSSLFVPEGAPNRELAFELMLALTEDEVALRLAQEEGRLPARHRVFEHPVFASSPDLAAFVAQLPTAEVMPLIAYPEVAAAFREALEESLSGRRPAAAALADVQRFAARWLDERGGGG